MLTASVAAASMSESFSYRLMHITPNQRWEKTSFYQPLAFIIARSFAGEKRKNGADALSAPFLYVFAQSELIRTAEDEVTARHGVGAHRCPYGRRYADGFIALVREVHAL